MKKYLLLGLTPLLLCSFTLAHDVSFSCNGVSNSDGEVSCSPASLDSSDFDGEEAPTFDGSQITVSNIRDLVDEYGTIMLRLDCIGDYEGEPYSAGAGDFIFDVSNDGERDFGYFNGSFGLSFDYVSSCDLNASLLYYDESTEMEASLPGVSVSSFFQGDYLEPDYVYKDSEPDEPDDPLTPPDEPGTSGTGDIGGGGSDVPGGDSSDSSLLSMFTPILTSLKGVIFEFIPYVVYIGLGILGAIIGFVGIKWLILRVRKKIFGSFKY